MKHNLQFYTDYGQFYICDKNSPAKTNSENFWTDEAFDHKLAVEDGILGIGIAKQFGKIKVEIELLKEANTNFSGELYNHIVEGDLQITSGVLQIRDCPNLSVELEINVDKNNYRVRAYSFRPSLKKVADYKIEIWPVEPSGKQVIKKI